MGSSRWYLGCLKGYLGASKIPTCSSSRLPGNLSYLLRIGRCIAVHLHSGPEGPWTQCWSQNIVACMDLLEPGTSNNGCKKPLGEARMRVFGGQQAFGQPSELVWISKPMAVIGFFQQWIHGALDGSACTNPSSDHCLAA